MGVSDKAGFDYEETRHGFRWGPMTVERVMSDKRIGVVVRVALAHSPGKFVDVRVSPEGRALHVDSHELPVTAPMESARG